MEGSLVDTARTSGETRSRWALIAALSALAMVTATIAQASHTDQPASGIEEVGFHDLGNSGFNTDVWTWVPDDERRLYAASGTWGSLLGDDACPSTDDNPLDPQKSGVKIVEATDPANPELVARIGTVPGSQNNDVKVLRLQSGDHAGRDILAHSLEPCGGLLGLAILQGGTVPPIPNSHTGFKLYDVSEPSGPVALGTYNNGALGVHNLYMFNRPDLGRAFVGLTHNEQSVVDGVRGEVQFVDITEPAGTAGVLGPLPVSTWELADAEAQGGPSFDDLCRPRGEHISACVLHDLWVSEDGTIAYLSFWDAGLILLDISDVENPTFIGQAQGQTQLPDDPDGWLNEEGNTHAAVPLTPAGDLVVIGDEDFVGPGLEPNVTVNAAPEGSAVAPGDSFAGVELSDTRPLSEGSVGSAALILADDEFGCAWAAGAAFGLTGDWIGIARRGGTCPLFQQKVSAAETAGASGVIVVDDGQGLTSGLAAGTIPAMMVTQGDGDALIASLDPTALGGVEVTMEMLPAPELNPWGFMRVLDVSDPDPANWREVAQFKAPHVEDLPGPEDVFSAHNPIVGPDGRVYMSWYTDGVRVLDVDPTGGATNEVAWFVPLPSDHPDDLDRDPRGIQEDNIGFWGSFPICDPLSDDLLVFNSDLNRGLYILRMLIDDRGACDGETPPPLVAFVTGGGKAPGSSGDGPVSFGFNVRNDGEQVKGHISARDHGTGQHIRSIGIESLTVDGDTIVVSALCSVDDAAAEPCEVRAVDRGESGAGDEFFIEVGAEGSTYSAGGGLSSGNVEIR